MTTQIKLEKGFYGDYCDWEHEIEATITEQMGFRILQAQRLLKQNRFIFSIDVEVADGVFHAETEQLLFEQCAFDVHYFQVYRHGYSYYLQGKYDSRIQAEYTPI